MPVGSLDQLLGQLNTLGFPPGQRRAGLSQSQIPQSDIAHKLDCTLYHRYGGKKAIGFGESHLEHIGYGLSFV